MNLEYINNCKYMDDIKNLYEDDLRLVLKKSVTQDVLNELAKR